ncbi:MAG: hypothetical protein Q9170_002441 [Blastenia crenularia]
MTTGSIRDTGFGHIKERRRLNVANTRCIFSITILLDREMMKGNQTDLEPIDEQEDSDETDTEEAVADRVVENGEHLGQVLEYYDKMNCTVQTTGCGELWALCYAGLSAELARN